MLEPSAYNILVVYAALLCCAIREYSTYTQVANRLPHVVDEYDPAVTDLLFYGTNCLTKKTLWCWRPLASHQKSGQ
ncbi:hypothetical protein M405DRAFT_570556 [Rhizopogon salebrosus TDB-379]|nr:hypothetical protein M405DRAFT_570556 [Rhizopogon salebrosus TDB-379]